MRRHARLVVALATAALLVLSSSACGGDDDAAGADETESEVDGSTTSETTASDEDTTTTTVALTPEEELLRDYEAANVAFSEAHNPPNPDSPGLLAHYAGDRLERIQSRIEGMRGAGAGGVNSVEVHPSNVVITGDTATLRDCFVDRSQHVDLATGELLGEPGETVGHVDVELQRIDGVWKVVQETPREDTCTPG